MRTLLFAAVSAVALAACGGADPAAACADYIAAVNTCYDSLEGTITATAPVDDTFCVAYDGVSGAAGDDAATLLDCYAAAYNDADCTTLDGVTAAGTAVNDCAAAAL